MWRLVRHPDDSLCIGKNDEERAIPVELRARPRPPMPTAHLWVFSAAELALALWKNSELMFFNFFASTITNAVVQCRSPSRFCAMSIHVVFMVSMIPFMVTLHLFPELVMIVVHVILYVFQFYDF